MIGQSPQLMAWVQELVAHCTPEQVYWCDGSKQEYARLSRLLVDTGTFIRLKKRPQSFLCRSEPGDVARVEGRTYICAQTPDAAGPLNNWRDPEEMRKLLLDLFKGCMKGRTLYVIPYSMGPLNSPLAKIGVELTDSPYVVLNMHLMARVGVKVQEALGEGPFVKGLHSVGVPLAPGQADTPWPCHPTEKYIVHFPETREIWSFGSGYGGNALLGKKCFALRIASVLARDEGWLAEHMVILKLTSPAGEVKYFTAAFPSQCGKTNLAMLTPTIPGWKVETIGDDIAWMRFGPDGLLYAMNPESGFFGVAPGTSARSNPHALDALHRNAIFTNCALTPDGDVWWEDLTAQPPPELTDWLRRPWTPGCGRKAAHPNARFTVSARQCPVLAKEYHNPRGVPISAILFGGRRATVLPLVHEARSWNHGVFMGSAMSSETTHAAAGQTGVVRRDPFAMLPFCGYHMGDYFAHWLQLGAQADPVKLPRIFYVNWYRKGAQGEYLWPGFGENSRVLKWIFERVNGSDAAVETPIGAVPAPDALDVSGLSIAPQAVQELLHVDVDGWLAELPLIREHYARFGERLPQALRDELATLEQRLRTAK